VDVFNSRGGALPALKCREFYPLREELFTSEEAEIAIRMPQELVSV